MSKIKIKLNDAGVQELLKEGIAPVIKERADEIVARCGAGYTSDFYVGQTRCNAMIYPEDAEAYQDNAENDTILRSLL